MYFELWELVSCRKGKLNYAVAGLSGILVRIGAKILLI